MTYNLYDKQTNIHIPSKLTFDRLFYRFKGIFISRSSQTSSPVSSNYMNFRLETFAVRKKQLTHF